MTWLEPLAVFPVQEVLVRHQNSVRLADVGLEQLPTKLLGEAVVVIALGSFPEWEQLPLVFCAVVAVTALGSFPG